MESRSQTRRRKAPVQFPRPNPDYPVKAWIHGDKRFETVTVRQDDGTFLSVIATDQSIRSTAKTRSVAEKGVIKRYLQSFSVSPAASDDEGDGQELDDIRYWKQHKNEPSISLEEYLSKRGKRKRRA